MEKYHPSSMIQDFVFLSRKRCCIRCISLQVYNNFDYQPLRECNILLRPFTLMAVNLHMIDKTE